VPSRLLSCLVTQDTIARTASIPDFGFFDRPSLEPCDSSSSSHAKSPLRSSFAVPPVSSFQIRLDYLGLFPLRDFVESIHLPLGLHTLAMFRPQAFSTSRRFAPLSMSWAYFIPLPRSGLFPFRGFSRFVALTAHRCSVPPCRWLAFTRRRTDCHSCKTPTSRLYSTKRCVPPGRVLRFPSAVPLFGFLLLQAPLPP